MPEAQKVITKIVLSAAKRLLVVAVCASLSGCDTVVLPPTPEFPTATVSVLPVATASPTTQYIFLPQLSGAQRIRIRDEWKGLNSLSPILSLYNLKRDGEEFVGDVQFSVGGEEPQFRKVATDTIVIRSNTIQDFLRVLQTSTVREGKYEPNPISAGTDNYPDIEIELQLESETIMFFTRAYGNAGAIRERIPGSPWGCCGHAWALDYRDRIYVLDTIHPDEALAIMDPYLKRDVLAKLMIDHGSRK